MIESYAFLAMFTLQIVVMSVLHPARLIRYCRVKMAEYPPERFPQLYSGGTFGNLSTERFLTIYRALNTGIAVIGALLLGLMFNEVQLLDRHKVTAFYFLFQGLPLLVLAVIGLRYLTVYRTSILEAKRKAVLQRRGLFDFIAPSTLLVAILVYLAFVAYMLYIAPKIGIDDSLIGIGTVTLVYALSVFQIYIMLYGKKLNPLETHAGRVHAIGMSVKSAVYGCIVCVAFLSIFFTLAALDLQSWKPFAISACLVISGLICLTAYALPPREVPTEPVS